MTGDAITVTVATCGRPASLARCLEALARGTTQPRETIVVDQAPSPITRRVVEQCGIAGARYIEQRRLGLVHRMPPLRRDIGDDQHVGAVLGEIEPVPDILAQHRWFGPAVG